MVVLRSALRRCVSSVTPAAATPKVSFTSLHHCTAADMEMYSRLYAEACTSKHLTKRALGMLLAQKGSHTELGAHVDLYEHGMQTASRAYRDGAPVELVVCGLLHDIGELYSPSNHGDIPAAILRPYISREAHWLLAHHEVFQMKYYGTHVGLNPTSYLGWSDGKDGGHFGPAPGNAFAMTQEFCEKYDAPSFDPAYESLPLETFIPLMDEVFSKPAFWDEPNSRKKGTVCSS